MSQASEDQLRVAVTGAQGRVGREIVAALENQAGFACVAAIEIGDDVTAQLRESQARVLVDFTTPHAAFGNATAAAELGVSPVVGTTGIARDDVDRIRARCREKGIGGCVIPNFALGAALMMWLAELCAPHFEMCEIIEAHHGSKVDAPSGTALRTAERLLDARDGRSFHHPDPTTTPLQGTRGGVLGGAGVHSLRLEGLVADQSVVFGAVGQTLTLSHRTTSRTAFVPGVLLAAQAVVAEGASFFRSLEEVLGLPTPASVRSSQAP